MKKATYGKVRLRKGAVPKQIKKPRPKTGVDSQGRTIYYNQNQGSRTWGHKYWSKSHKKWIYIGRKRYGPPPIGPRHLQSIRKPRKPQIRPRPVRSMPDKKIFDHRRYIKERSTVKKPTAQQLAKRLRNQGQNARVIRDTSHSKQNWTVYKIKR